MTQNDLLPCPFCGGPAVTTHDPIYGYQVQCGAPYNNCGAIHIRMSPDAWDRRPTPPADAQRALEALKGEADAAYCRYIDKMSAKDCLGYEAKIKAGEFGKQQLDAHTSAHEDFGFHRGINHALETLRANLQSQLTKTTENVSCKNLANADESERALRALDLIIAAGEKAFEGEVAVDGWNTDNLIVEARHEERRFLQFASFNTPGAQPNPRDNARFVSVCYNQRPLFKTIRACLQSQGRSGEVDVERELSEDERRIMSNMRSSSVKEKDNG